MTCRREFINLSCTLFLNSPTIREICDGVGKNSTATISLYLEELEDIGRIILGHGPRTIKLVGFKVVEECEH